MTKKTNVSIEDFKQLENKVESLLKAFRGSHESGKLSRQRIEALEENISKFNERLDTVEETCENIKDNPKYSILTEGEYDLDNIESDLKITDKEI